MSAPVAESGTPPAFAGRRAIGAGVLGHVASGAARIFASRRLPVRRSADRRPQTSGSTVVVQRTAAAHDAEALLALGAIEEQRGGGRQQDDSLRVLIRLLPRR